MSGARIVTCALFALAVTAVSSATAAVAEVEPIFDLAQVESTAEGSAVAAVEWNGGVAPAMILACTDDGSHRNSVGRFRAARELIPVLAYVQGSTPGASPAH